MGNGAEAVSVWRGFSKGQQIAVVLLGLVALAGVVAHWWISRPPDPIVRVGGEGATLELGADSAGKTASEDSLGDGRDPVPAQSPHTVVVHVAGAVRRPGIYTLREGERVAAAIEAAGGATSKALVDALNLAAKLLDGQKVIVPEKGRAGLSAPTGSGSSGSSETASTIPDASQGLPAAAPINLNSASLQELDGLPGIGPQLAQRIIDYRESHGGFRSVNELRQVEGIGEKRFLELKNRCTT